MKRHFQVAAGGEAEPEEIGTIGDVNFAEHGGGIVYCRRAGGQTDIWGDCFVEYIEEPSDDEEFDSPKARWTVYRVDLDPEVPSWGDLEAVAATSGQNAKELEAEFTSTNPQTRANAYWTWAMHYGWHEFDQYPLELTCAEMNERYDADLDCYGAIQTELEQVVERMVEQSAAQSWSTPGDELADEVADAGYDSDSIIILARFGDATAVNGDFDDDATLDKLDAKLAAEGYEFLDQFGGRVPTTEAFASFDHAVRAVSREMKIPAKQVEAAAKALGWDEEEIAGSASGGTYVWARKLESSTTEERRRPRASARRRTR